MGKVRYLFSLLACIWMALTADAQDLGFGFRAGLSYAKISGDSEIGGNGEELEEFSLASGFHIGFTFNYKITDLFGLRSELLFVQKGTEYDYNGESWFILGRGTNDEISLSGTRIQSVNVSTATIEVPLSAYHRVGPFEVSGGVNVSFLLGASGGGSLRFEGLSPGTGNALDPIEVRLNYNYFQDEAGAVSIATTPVNVDGFTYQVPNTFGAYYLYEEKDGNFFNIVDVGLHAGLSYFLNESLFLGVSANWGLLDVDDNQYDISLRELGPNRSYISREDDNKSFALLISIGFSF